MSEGQSPLQWAADYAHRRFAMEMEMRDRIDEDLAQGANSMNDMRRTQEFTDEYTGMCMRVVHDDTEYPFLALHSPEYEKFSEEELTQAIQRLFRMAALQPPTQQATLDLEQTEGAPFPIPVLSSAPIQVTSNVIELKPDKQYIFVFKSKDMSMDTIHAFSDSLQAQGFVGIGVVLAGDDELTVIEAPVEQEEADEPPLFLGGE